MKKLYLTILTAGFMFVARASDDRVLVTMDGKPAITVEAFKGVAFKSDPNASLENNQFYLMYLILELIVNTYIHRNKIDMLPEYKERLAQIKGEKETERENIFILNADFFIKYRDAEPIVTDEEIKKMYQNLLNSDKKSRFYRPLDDDLKEFIRNTIYEDRKRALLFEKIEEFKKEYNIVVNEELLKEISQ